MCRMSITPEVSAKTLTQLVATEIKVAMARADVRQSQLARELGKNEQWLSVRLRGRQPIDLNDLALIARALGVGVHELLPSPEAAAAAAEALSRTTGATSGRATQTIVPDHSTLQPIPAQAAVRRPAARPGRHTVTTGTPYGGGRRDAVRPVSAIPAARRRPTRVGP